MVRRWGGGLAAWSVCASLAVSLLSALAPAALAQTTENASKLNSYVLLAPGPENSALASKALAYVVLDSSPTTIGSTKLNGYAVLDGTPNIIGTTKLTTYVVLGPVPATGFFLMMPR